MGLLGTHECRSSQRRARQRLGAAAARGRNQGTLLLHHVGSGPADGLGQAPVDDEGFTMFTDDDIAGLQVAVEHAAAVRIFDRVADVQEAAQELLLFERATAGISFQGLIGVKRGYGFFEAVTSDEPHGVERASVRVGSDSVDRDDAGVLESAGDLGLDLEAPAAHRVVGIARRESA